MNATEQKAIETGTVEQLSRRALWLEQAADNLEAEAAAKRERARNLREALKQAEGGGM